MNIQEVQTRSYEIAGKHGFHDTADVFSEAILLMHAELSEAVEDFRNHHKLNEIYYEGQKPCGIPIELADCVIRIAHFCERHGISLTQAISLKMTYNETRPFKHGNKKI